MPFIEKRTRQTPGADEKVLLSLGLKSPVLEVNIFLDSKSRSGVARLRGQTDGFSSVFERGCKTFCEPLNLRCSAYFFAGL